ncbi:LytR/AlgR family response regulator transcription factor [Terrimonas alba]|uniref:LytR/AlgR family response regulator transcription factor n=1 Tax=Terrimonas alba TaxID=3349636 RepID=UPI0035F285CC
MHIFKQSFPFTSSWKSQLKTALGFGLFVLTFLLVFKPFGLDAIPMNWLWLVSISYGCITFGCIFLMLLTLPFLFPHFFKEDKWTTGRQILHTIAIVVVVGWVNYLVSPFLVETTYSWRDMLWFQGITLAVALLPVTVFTLWKQNSLLKKFERQAVVLEKKLKEKLDIEKQQESFALPQEKKIDFPAIELTGDYQGEKIVLQPEDLYFITAANNYIKVYFVKNARLREKDNDDKIQLKPSYSIIRMTMKKAEEMLEAWPVFFRCHRAYIINLDKVAHVEGNAQGYKIRLAHTEELIPVSRNLNSEFSDKLLAIRDNAALSTGKY